MWLQGYDARRSWSPNAITSGALQGHFARPQTVRLFGRPFLEWTPEEARQLAAASERCGFEVAAGRMWGPIGPFQQMYFDAQRLADYLTLRQQAQDAGATARSALLRAPQSGPLAAFEASLAQASLGRPAFEEARRRSWSLPPAQRAAAERLLAAIEILPEAEAAALLSRSTAAQQGGRPAT